MAKRSAPKKKSVRATKARAKPKAVRSTAATKPSAAKPAATKPSIAKPAAAAAKPAVARDLRHEFVQIAMRLGTEEAQRLLDRIVDVQTPVTPGIKR